MSACQRSLVHAPLDKARSPDVTGARSLPVNDAGSLPDYCPVCQILAEMATPRAGPTGLTPDGKDVLVILNSDRSQILRVPVADLVTERV